MLDTTSSTEKKEILPLRKEKKNYVMLFMSLIAIVQNLVISHNFCFQFSQCLIHLSSKIKRARQKDILILTAELKQNFPT